MVIFHVSFFSGVIIMVLLAHLPLQGDLRAVNYSSTDQNGVHPIDGAPYDFTSSKGGSEIFNEINDIGGGSHERLSGITVNVE